MKVARQSTAAKQRRGGFSRVAPDGSCLGTQRLVEEKAGEEWFKLEDAEKQIFETLAEGKLTFLREKFWRPFAQNRFHVLLSRCQTSGGNYL